MLLESAQSNAIYNPVTGPLPGTNDDMDSNRVASIAIDVLEIENMEPRPLHTRIITKISDAIESVRTMGKYEFRIRLLAAFIIVAMPTAAILDAMQGRPLLPDP